MTTVQHQRIIGAILLFSLIFGIAMLLIRSAHQDDIAVDLEPKPIVGIKSDYVEITEPYIDETIVNLESDSERSDVELVEHIETKTNTAPAPAPASIVDNLTDTAWLIQLASFSVKENAVALSSQVKNMGYKAVIQSSDTANGKIYRVRLEPIKDKNNADKIASELNTKLKLTTQIMQE